MQSLAAAIDNMLAIAVCACFGYLALVQLLYRPAIQSVRACLSKKGEPDGDLADVVSPFRMHIITPAHCRSAQRGQGFHVQPSTSPDLSLMADCESE
jgi:hypothetical protein